jgi:transposase
MSRKRYPKEFKVEAVKQVTEAGYSVYDVAERLGTTTNSLYSWIRRYGPNASDFKAVSEESDEIRRLKKELKRVTDERDLLKKAAAYFASHPE